ncbi:hypothetical protein SAMN05518856_109155 [Paenibacillus sp. OK003]|nr:hypothetical protein SAMN05518856_109155 [Paenibacillus sp. OK003]
MLKEHVYPSEHKSGQKLVDDFLLGLNYYISQ